MIYYQEPERPSNLRLALFLILTVVIIVASLFYNQKMFDASEENIKNL